MVETTGKKLSKARLAKGLSIDDAAHATKLRPEKILALEHDDYTRFPNNAYVKGFLQLYGRYVGVDVSATVKDLENPNPVSVADYQYLNHAPQLEPQRISARRQAGKPSLAPLIVFLMLCGLAASAGYLYLNAQRLNDDRAPLSDGAEAAAETASQLAGKARAAEPAGAPVTPSAGLAEAPAADVSSAKLGAPALLEATPPSASSKAEPPASGDRDFVNPTPVPPAAPMNEVVVQPLKKTWVKVRRDDPNSAPIFEGVLYTNAPPLKLRGARLFIEVPEEGAVSIRKNGAPIAYEAPLLTIQ